MSKKTHPIEEKLIVVKRYLSEHSVSLPELADAIYVVNVGGYIGSSTRSDIDYAREHGQRNMKRIISILVMAFLSVGVCHAQKITDGSYRSVGYIKADGTIQDASYRTIGHAKDLPKEWAALYFFFKH